MGTPNHRPLRFVVGTMLLGLGGGACTSAETTHVNPGPETITPPDAKPPDAKPPEVKPPESKVPEAKPPEVKPPEVKPPETKTTGGCQPPDCHINPGPTDREPKPVAPAPKPG